MTLNNAQAVAADGQPSRRAVNAEQDCRDDHAGGVHGAEQAGAERRSQHAR